MVLIKNQLSSLNFQITLLVLSTFGLYVLYFGGTGDINLFVQAGEKISNGTDPYLDSEYANSPLAAVVIHLISLLAPGSAFTTIVISLNLIGVIGFIILLSKNSSVNSNFGIAILALALSIPFRALIANVQVTGLLLGLFALAYKLNTKRFYLCSFLQYLCIGCAVELKPQVALPFALIFLIKKWNVFSALSAAFVFLALHLYVSIRFGGFLDLLWIEKIGKFSDKSLLVGPEISVWKFFANLHVPLSVLSMMAALLLLAYYTTFFVFRKSSLEKMLLLASLGPLLSSYGHMYDLVPFMLLLGLNLFLTPPTKFILLFAFIVPGGETYTLVVPFTVIAYSILYAFLRKYDYDFNHLFLLPPLYLIVIFIFSISSSNGDLELELSTRVAFLVPILIYVFYKNFNGYKQFATG